MSLRFLWFLSFGILMKVIIHLYQFVFRNFAKTEKHRYFADNFQPLHTN